jgi:hypothetical protein
MDKYQLSSDPCDYRLIRINNCLQLLACFCDILALIDENLRSIANIIDRIADLMYQIISGCMTAQTAYEVDYQNERERSQMVAQLYDPSLIASPSQAIKVI